MSSSKPFAAYGSGITSATISRLYLSNGTEAEPSYSFENATDAGMYTDSNGYLNFSVNGTRQLQMQDGVIVPEGYVRPSIDGDSVTPVYSFESSTNSGMSVDGAGDLHFSANGVDVMQLEDDFCTVNQRMTVQDGTEALPGIRSMSDNDTGIYYTSGGDPGVCLTAGGSKSFKAGDGYVRSYNQVVLENTDGEFGDYTIGFLDSSSVVKAKQFLNSGGDFITTLIESGQSIIHETSDGGKLIVRSNDETVTNVDFQVRYGLGAGNGYENCFVVNENEVSSTLPLRTTDGTAGAPAYSFADDSNIGFYRIAADRFGASLNGALAVEFNGASKTVELADGFHVVPHVNTEICGETNVTGSDTISSSVVEAGSVILATVKDTAGTNQFFATTGTIVANTSFEVHVWDVSTGALATSAIPVCWFIINTH